MIADLNDAGLLQLLAETRAAEASIKLSQNINRERAADAERDLFSLGKSLACVGVLREELEGEISKREQAAG